MNHYPSIPGRDYYMRDTRTELVGDVETLADGIRQYLAVQRLADVARGSLTDFGAVPTIGEFESIGGNRQ